MYGFIVRIRFDSLMVVVPLYGAFFVLFVIILLLLFHHEHDVVVVVLFPNAEEARRR